MSDEKKISRARVAEYFKVVCEFLKERGGEAKKVDVLKAFKFVKTVDHNVMHALANGVTQFVRRLVIAMQHTTIGRNTGT